MRTMFALAAAVIVGATAAAYATDRAHDGTKSAAQRAIPAGQIKINVDKLGYDVAPKIRVSKRPTFFCGARAQIRPHRVTVSIETKLGARAGAATLDAARRRSRPQS